MPSQIEQIQLSLYNFIIEALIHPELSMTVEDFAGTSWTHQPGFVGTVLLFCSLASSGSLISGSSFQNMLLIILSSRSLVVWSSVLHSLKLSPYCINRSCFAIANMAASNPHSISNKSFHPFFRNSLEIPSLPETWQSPHCTMKRSKSANPQSYQVPWEGGQQLVGSSIEGVPPSSITVS